MAVENPYSGQPQVVWVRPDGQHDPVMAEKVSTVSGPPAFLDRHIRMLNAGGGEQFMLDGDQPDDLTEGVASGTIYRLLPDPSTAL